MRSPKQLERMVTGILVTSGGSAPFDLLAVDEAEEEWFKARLKGRHGAKLIGIKRGTPEDLLPIMERIRPWTEDTPAAPVKDPKLTEDGY